MALVKDEIGISGFVRDMNSFVEIMEKCRQKEIKCLNKGDKNYYKKLDKINKKYGIED